MTAVTTDQNPCGSPSDGRKREGEDAGDHDADGEAERRNVAAKPSAIRAGFGFMLGIGRPFRPLRAGENPIVAAATVEGNRDRCDSWPEMRPPGKVRSWLLIGPVDAIECVVRGAGHRPRTLTLRKW